MKNEIKGFSFWMHFPDADKTNDAKRIAQRHIDFFRKYKFDFLKFSPHGLYAAEVFGGNVFYPEGELPIMKDFVINDATSDLEEIDASSNKTLQLHIEALRIIKKEINLPVVETVYSPMTIMTKMSAEGIMQKLFIDEKKKLKEHIKTVEKSMSDYVGVLRDIGIGIFYAVQLNHFDYSEFIGHDMNIVKKADFGVLHLHDFNPNFKSFLKLPLSFISWENEKINLNDVGNKTPVQGIDREAVFRGDFEKIKSDIEDLLKIRGDSVIGPNCILNHKTPEINLEKLNAIVKEVLKRKN